MPLSPPIMTLTSAGATRLDLTAHRELSFGFHRPCRGQAYRYPSAARRRCSRSIDATANARLTTPPQQVGGDRLHQAIPGAGADRQNGVVGSLRAGNGKKFDQGRHGQNRLDHGDSFAAQPGSADSPRSIRCDWRVAPLQQHQGCSAVAGLEKFRVGHEHAELAAPLSIVANHQYRAPCDAPIVCCRRAGQSETLRAGNF